MSYLVIARKYRPQTFEDVVAQEHVTTTLKNAIETQRVHHALCLSGPRGTGKTTVARIFAKSMNCVEGPTATPCNECAACREITRGNSVDVFEIDGASNNGVDQIRDLRENVKYAPARGPYKIYIIDEVHMLSMQAFNALLKTLEEPPSHVLFVLATTEFHKIPVTIRSRCLRFDFKRIRPDDIVDRMAYICENENLPVSRGSLELVARESDGCMRDALSLLDQLAAYSSGAVDEKRVLEILGVVSRSAIFDLAAALLARDVAACLRVVDEMHQMGLDMKKLAADMVAHFRNCVVARTVDKPRDVLDLPETEIRWILDAVSEVPVSHVEQVLGILHKEEVSVRLSNMPKLALEIACIQVCETPPSLGIDELLERLDRLQNALQSGEPVPAAASAPTRPAASSAPAAPAGGPEGKTGANPGPAASQATEPEAKGLIGEPSGQDEEAPPLSAYQEAGGAPRPGPESESDPAPESPATKQAPAPGPDPEPEPEPSAVREPVRGAPRIPPEPAAVHNAKPSAELYEQFMEAISGRHPMLAPCLAECTLAVDGNRVVIRTSGGDFAMRLLTDEENRANIAAVCGECLGREVAVLVEAAAGDAGPVRETPAPGPGPHSTKNVVDEALNHPLVTEAMEIFRGQVVDVKPLDIKK
ncbi:MAG: DNA polymerase III subunit gamma/tau [Desulfatibacillaceae bacterium]